MKICRIGNESSHRPASLRRCGLAGMEWQGGMALQRSNVCTVPEDVVLEVTVSSHGFMGAVTLAPQGGRRSVGKGRGRTLELHCRLDG